MRCHGWFEGELVKEGSGERWVERVLLEGERL